MTSTTLSGEDVAGQLLLPGDPGYDDARRVWNAMVDRRPRMIFRCASVDDVRAALGAARKHDLEVGVRCGGHSILGLPVPDGGMMIDLTPLAAVRVDPERRRARVQGGAPPDAGVGDVARRGVFPVDRALVRRAAAPRGQPRGPRAAPL